MGGNTSCVAIAHDGDLPVLALDAGTGIRNLTTILGGQPFCGTIVLGHLHWDHTYGIPFFSAGDRPDARVRVLVPEQGADVVGLLSRWMGPPHFPITPTELRGDWTFGWYDEGEREVEGFTVRAREIPHKGGRTMGVRVSDGRSSIAYLSDHAPQVLGPGDDGLGVLHEAAIDLARGVDLLIHDAQYTAEELPVRGHFGHAAYEYAVRLAVVSGARAVALFHHDPARTDDEVDAITEAARGHGVDVVLAVEGLVVEL